MDMNEAVAKAIAAERGASGLTIKALAEKSQIPERTLIRILKGERDIHVDQIARLSDVFGITPARLFEEAQDFKARDERPAPMPVSPIGDAMAQLEKKAGWKANYTTAAYRDPNKKVESETPDD